ncbi:hypothetical protein EST38_g12703 [Candolleomyces aberdarensis]|uniref:Uncharacterized protein n=1 Tax=Candolleomyces aberdarensis TaxID=2316362 RepID=A0A4Q2D1S0_9AGAR|nr:hypothetical protein EST38_g12703 [Candolleomyces aberdarensis]
MDFTPEQLAQLRAIFAPPNPPNTQGTIPPQPPPPAPSQASTPAAFAPPLSQPQPSQQVQAQDGAGIGRLPVAAPVNQPYISARSGLSGQANTGFQPFLGAARLGGPLNTRHANQARVASASRNLPRPVHLPSQNGRAGSARRGRGPSVHPPALNPPPSLQSSINSCQYVDVDGERNMVQVTVKIYPVHENSGTTFILYRFIREQVNRWLQAHHLLINLELDITTPVSELMNTLVFKLEHCPMQYEFPSTVSRANLQLRLLALMNRGQSTSIGYVRLKPHASDAGLTLADLLADKANFVGASSVCFESQRLVIYTAANSLSYIINHRRHGHTKLAKAFEKAFPRDSPFSPLAVSNETNSEDDSGEETEIDEAAVQIPPSIPRVGSFAPSPYLPHEIWVDEHIPDLSIIRYTVSIYAERDEASHKQLASEMLYRAVLGPSPPSHEEFKSFSRGFSLRCPDRNFNFIQVLKEVEGGSDVFLSLVWASQVGPERLIEHTDVVFTQAFNVQLSERGVVDSPRDLFEKFVAGRGIPNQQDLDNIIGNLSPLVDLNQSSSSTWRARMLTLAATGHPFLEEGSDQVNVQFVDDQHPAVSGTYRPSFQAGTVTLRTCARQIMLPSIFILSMAQEHQNQHEEVPLFQEVFDQWLIVQLLTAIGGHSIF